MGCGAKFGFTKRRHHCRCSGLIFCSKCTPNKAVLPLPPSKDGAELADARVCDHCLAHHELGEADCLVRLVRLSLSVFFSISHCLSVCM